MSQALYRKYRSRTFDEIVGQKSVVMALTNAMAANSLSHAYLFTGPRGVGKTSIARIFAHAINSVPYSDDSLPVDIIEIDAASNRGIDEVRDLRDKVRIAPVTGPYKIYIIDEVHMLTSHAFNALLKTLEEPPKHVIFILATTESHKLPETILSRTQRYNFKLASVEDTMAHLRFVAEAEKIVIDNDAIELIAVASGGSMRDALSLLDHARHLGSDISLEDIRSHIGIPSQESVKNVLKALQRNDPAAILLELDKAASSGVTAVSFASTTIDYITKAIQQGSLELSLSTATKLLYELIAVESSTQQDTRLQLALLAAINGADITVEKIHHHTESVPTPTVKNNATILNIKANHKKETPTNKTKINDTTRNSKDTANAVLDERIWAEIQDTIRQSHNTLYSILRMASVDWSLVQQRVLKLDFSFPFHQKRMNDGKNIAVISQSLEQFGLNDYQIKCEVIAKESAPHPVEAVATVIEAKNAPDLQQIRGVFGSAEVLE